MWTENWNAPRKLGSSGFFTVAGFAVRFFKSIKRNWRSMKTGLVISALAFLFSGQVVACSEPGPHDFDISSDMQTTCAKTALKYATDFANTIVKIEKNENGYDGPNGGFKPYKPVPSLYTTQKRAGNTKLIGFNVGLNAKNKWECNFCVDMTLDDKGNCRVESIRKHMCAK